MHKRMKEGLEGCAQSERIEKYKLKSITIMILIYLALVFVSIRVAFYTGGSGPARSKELAIPFRC